MADEGNYSDWNQHHAWSFQFHILSWECRKCQETKDVIHWNDKLEALMVHCDAFMTDPERDKLDIQINKIRTLMNTYLKIPVKIRSNKLGEIYKEMMILEINLRRIVNLHFPFLKEKDDDDFGAM